MIKRLFLAFAALVLLFGSFMHASAFNRIISALAESNLASFAANSLKVLWLVDSITSLFLAVVFGLAAARPSMTTRWVIVLLALIPTATAALIYIFIGNFIGGHIQLAAGIAALIGGLQYPGTNSPSPSGFPIARI